MSCFNFHIPEFVQSSTEKTETNSETNENPVNNIIDEDTSTYYLSASTGTTANPVWVRVKFAAQLVAKVELVNQLVGTETGDCTSEHGSLTHCSLKNSTVSLWLKGNEVKECGSVVGLNTETVEEFAQTYTVYCWGVEGDAVTVEKKIGYLSFSEIRIYRRRKFSKGKCISNQKLLLPVKGNYFDYKLNQLNCQFIMPFVINTEKLTMPYLLTELCPLGMLTNENATTQECKFCDLGQELDHQNHCGEQCKTFQF